MSTPEPPRPTSPQTASSETVESSSPPAVSAPGRASAPSRPAASRSTQTGPVLTKEGVPLARVRRAPRVLPFIVTGALLGAIVGLVIAYAGDDGGNYTEASSVGYLVVLCSALGAMLGGVAFAVADKRS